jgi:hypothetical protein
MRLPTETPASIIAFLQTLPPDQPIWAFVVTADEVRASLHDCDYAMPDGTAASDHLIAEAMRNYDKSMYFADSTPLSDIVDESVSLITNITDY